MNDNEQYNKAIQKLDQKRQQANKFIGKQLRPGEDPPTVDINEMRKAFKEFADALEEVKKIRAALIGK